VDDLAPPAGRGGRTARKATGAAAATPDAKAAAAAAAAAALAAGAPPDNAKADVVKARKSLAKYSSVVSQTNTIMFCVAHDSKWAWALVDPEFLALQEDHKALSKKIMESRVLGKCASTDFGKLKAALGPKYQDGVSKLIALTPTFDAMTRRLTVLDGIYKLRNPDEDTD